MNGLKFSVYEHRVVYENNNILSRQFVVLKDEMGNVVYWTNYHKYAGNSRKSAAKNIYSNSGKRCYNIVKFLNYVFFDKKLVTKLNDITADAVIQFLQDYGLCKLLEDNAFTHRNQTTVEICISHILDFLEEVVRNNPGCILKLKDLFRTESVFNKTKRKYIEKRVPNFTIYYKPNSKTILRDIPEDAFQILLNEIIENHKKILMLAALGAFAGMRPSECCNVRREDSALGPGIILKKVNDEIVDVLIDLREEKNLRSDFVNIGKIKKERMQKVYPAFLEVFVDCYNIYMQYSAGRPYEADYGALTNTSTGKAYTYNAYLVEFSKVIQACIPIMLSSDDQRTVNYGHLLQEHNITPHIFRHWFSVKLVLYGEDVAGLMNWRGDKSPESALTYLMNKSELVKEYETVNDEFINYALWKSEKLFGNKNG